LISAGAGLLAIDTKGSNVSYFGTERSVIALGDGLYGVRNLEASPFQTTEALETRLAKKSESLHREAEKLPLGIERERVFRKMRQVDAAFEIIEWLRSPGSQGA
jgi:hypothetical protein